VLHDDLKGCSRCLIRRRGGGHSATLRKSLAGEGDAQPRGDGEGNPRRGPQETISGGAATTAEGLAEQGAHHPGEGEPILPFIEGDGTGPDIWRASVRVFDAAVAKAYGGKKKIAWLEVYAGEKAFNQTGSWLPDETVEAFKKYLVGIKGPLTTPIGKGIRSLNVALRQMLDLYVCLRPVRWFRACPRP
jgi:hypothetical protein